MGEGVGCGYGVGGGGGCRTQRPKLYCKLKNCIVVLVGRYCYLFPMRKHLQGGSTPTPHLNMYMYILNLNGHHLGGLLRSPTAFCNAVERYKIHNQLLQHLYNCRGLSGISGMEQWNGIVEWNTGISFNCIFDSLGYFPAVQIFLKDVV